MIDKQKLLEYLESLRIDIRSKFELPEDDAGVMVEISEEDTPAGDRRTRDNLAYLATYAQARGANDLLDVIIKELNLKGGEE